MTFLPSIIPLIGADGGRAGSRTRNRRLPGGRARLIAGRHAYARSLTRTDWNGQERDQRSLQREFLLPRRARAQSRDRGARRNRLVPYYAEAGIDPSGVAAAPARAPFGAAICAVIEETRPAVVSFHFGLPPADWFSRVKTAGALILSSATTVAEARWLEHHGVDAIIAQGREAGGHRGMFLSDDIDGQPGLISLLPQVRDAVRLPVVAAGGISDWARNRGSLCARRGRGPDRHRLSAHAGGDDLADASRRARERPRRRNAVDERVHRAAGARHRQSIRGGSRTDMQGRAPTSAWRPERRRRCELRPNSAAAATSRRCGRASPQRSPETRAPRR